jgi:hypothetical protein
MVKVSVMLKRKPGMSTAEFHRYWKDVPSTIAQLTKRPDGHRR